MRDPSQHILFLATEYDAPGMRPYARNIINAMWQAGDQVLIVTRHGNDNGAFPEISPDDIHWIDYPASTLRRAVFRYLPTRLTRAIDDIIARHGISLVYSLTGELVLAGSIGRLQRRVPVLYTVHDAVYHDYKFSSPLQWLKDRLIIAWPQRYLFGHTRHKVTNSHDQLRLLQERYPRDKAHFAPFPTLVNDKIAGGGKPVEELRDIPGGYILFFGTLQYYKGVHLLYEAVLNDPGLSDRHLVIAGTGDIYFERREGDEGRVTFINRFVDDAEVRDLFSKAAVVVYPYISATQSGVISLASYFGRPMVLADLPFFKQTCGNSPEGVEFFPAGDRDALKAAIRRALANPGTTRSLYDAVYSSRAMNEALDKVIGNVLAEKRNKQP